jgi:hypothetical protein
MFDIQATTKSKYYDHIVLFYLEWLTEPERMYVNKHCVFHCIKSKTSHGGTRVQTIMYISITKGLCTLITHEDVVISRLFLFVFTYMFLWLTSSITQTWIK